MIIDMTHIELDFKEWNASILKVFMKVSQHLLEQLINNIKTLRDKEKQQ